MKHSSLILLSAMVFVCGCLRSKEAPPAPPSNEIDTAEERQFGYTGAVVYVAGSYACPPCENLKEDIAWLIQNRNWRDSDWQFETDNTGMVPRVAFYRNGDVIHVHEGYSTGSGADRRRILTRIVKRHPYYKY